MDTKIFKEPLTLEQAEKVINDYIAKEILNLQRKDILEKWNYFPIMALEEKETIQKFLETLEYIDALSLKEDIKIQYILTLCYLVLKERMKIQTMDVNNIFLLTSYLDGLALENIKPSLDYLNNETLLFKIRFKSLDIDIRKKLIEYIDKAKKKVEDAIQFIDSTEYYELLKTIES